jgi:hypothetical protein
MFRRAECSELACCSEYVKCVYWFQTSSASCGAQYPFGVTSSSVASVTVGRGQNQQGWAHYHCASVDVLLLSYVLQWLLLQQVHAARCVITFVPADLAEVCAVTVPGPRLVNCLCPGGC